MGASLGNNPSFVWQSLFSSKMVLKDGFRWRIGNGKDIDVWGTTMALEGRKMLASQPQSWKEGATLKCLILLTHQQFSGQ